MDNFEQLISQKSVPNPGLEPASNPLSESIESHHPNSALENRSFEINNITLSDGVAVSMQGLDETVIPAKIPNLDDVHTSLIGTLENGLLVGSLESFDLGVEYAGEQPAQPLETDALQSTHNVQARSTVKNDALIQPTYMANDIISESAPAVQQTEVTHIATAGLTQPFDPAAEILSVPGTNGAFVSLKFRWTEREAAFNNEVGVFLVDDLGRVNGLTPDHPDYAHAALTSASRQIIFTSGQDAGAQKQLQFAANDKLAFYLIQNNTSSNWLSQNPQNQLGQGPIAFFSLNQANPDQFDHLQSRLLPDGVVELRWEDLTGGGDRDFNDVVFTIAEPGGNTPEDGPALIVPGLSGQQVGTKFVWVFREATFNNEMGLFYVDDAQGRIGNLRPGDSGYAAAALTRQGSRTIFASGQTSGATAEVDLPSGQYIGFYLIQNNTTAEFLRRNPQNQVGQGPLAFFFFPEANPDGIDHVQQISNQISWEDLTGGGDRDFDDLIFQYEFGTPTGGLAQINISDISVVEGDSGTEQAQFLVELSQANKLPVSVDFATADGTAIAGNDYLSTAGTLVFAPGETRKFITVPIVGDTLSETIEQFSVRLSQAINASIANAEAIGTIQDNDTLPSLTIDDVGVVEGDSGTKATVFTARLSAASSQIVSVDYSTTDGTATTGDDYQAATGRLVFQPGETSKTIQVVVNGDLQNESDETFSVDLSRPQNAVIADGTGIGTIQDDDSPELSISDVQILEGDSGTKSAAFTVRLSQASVQPVTVQFATAGDTATSGVDFQATSSMLTFAPGETIQTIIVPIVGDTSVEVDETFTVTLDMPTNAVLGDAQGIGTILNDDQALVPSLSIADVTVVEGNDDITEAIFTVQLSETPNQTVTVNFTTNDETALAGLDYQAVQGTLTFNPGEALSQTIKVQIIGDIIDELDETFTLNLSDPTNAIIGEGSGVGTIKDDDLAGLSISDVSLIEGDSGTKNATFIVSLTNPISQPVSVNYATADGTALAGQDYETRQGTVTFRPGEELSQTIEIPIIGDILDELDESFTLNLSSPQNAILVDDIGEGRILDDDRMLIPPTIAANLLNDTGISNSDKLTIDPTVGGQITSDQPITSLQGRLNGQSFVDLSDALNQDNSFTLSLEQYERLVDGSMPDGSYTLELKGIDEAGQESDIANVSFILDRTAPPITFDLAPESDTGITGDKTTTERTVNLVGKTEPGLAVVITGTQLTRTADSEGNFIFTNVAMPVAGQAPYTMITVDAAGNQGRVQQFLIREGVNGAPEITSTPITTFDSTQQTTYTYQLQAIDPDGDPLTYTLLTPVQGAAIDSQGLLSFTPLGDMQPSYNFNVEASDDRGGKDVQNFTVEILAINENSGEIRGIKWNDLNSNGLRDITNFENFSADISSLQLNGSAAIVNSQVAGGESVVRLTPAQAWQAGNALLKSPFDLVGSAGETLSFSTNFKFLISNSGGISDEDGIGADGIVFIISPTENVGGAGVGIGYSGLNNSVAVELDTYNNRGIDRSNGNHISINLNGDLFAIEQTNISTRFNNGEIWNVWIDYEGLTKILEARVSQDDIRPIDPTVAAIVDIPQVLEQEEIFVGFTSGTGSAWGNHDILSWNFETNEPGLQDWIIYIDENVNSQRDEGELFTLTDEDGKYEFTNLLPGQYVVREELQPGWVQTSSPLAYTLTLNEGEKKENINFGNVEISDGNVAPRIVSTPITAAFTGIPYRYNVSAADANGDTLTYTLLTAPDGMSVNQLGVITWDAVTIGAYSVDLEVSDGKGGITTQSYTLNVTDLRSDTEAPLLQLGFNSTVLELGNTLDLQILATDNIGLADIDLLFDGTPIILNKNTVGAEFFDSTSITLNKTGVFELLATATDIAGNIGRKTVTVRVIDPTDTTAPVVELDLSQFDPLNPVITDLTNLVGTVNDDLEFYRVDLAPLSLIDINNPVQDDPDYITIATGTGSVDNGVLAQIDPNLYRNDTYYVRVYAQDNSGNINVQGVILGINSQNKPGEFSLEYTDLSIPLTGIPIEVNRTYSSLNASFQGDFGYGWEMGLQDAGIIESSPTGVDLNFDDVFGGNSFTAGTRVTMNTPDGRRVGFTFDPTPQGGILGTVWRPRFTADPGVYDTLSVENIPLTQYGDGSFGLYLFGLTYNPNQYQLTTKDGTVYNYDQRAGLQNVVDRNGNTLTFTDEGVISSTGAEINFVRDSLGRITEIIDPAGASILYRYDLNGDLVEVTDRTNNITTFKYDADRDHYLNEVIDPLGQRGIRTEYADNGQISRIIDASGNALDINYDSAASRQTVKDPFGSITTYIFDDRGNVVSEIDALGGVTARTYDANNNLTSETDPEGNTTTYTYDDRGNVLTKIDPLGNITRTTYNATSQILTEVDPLGNTTTYTYNAQGNLTNRQDAVGKVTTYSYDQYGLLTEVTDANGNQSTFSYDDFGNLIQLVDPTGASTTFTYDANGRVTSTTDALGAITNYIYDAQGRLLEKADPEGSSCGCARGITKTEYNAAGEKVAEIDALGRRTEYRYNERGLLVETIYPDATPSDLSDNPRSKNKYDALDRLIAVTDEAGRTTRYVYDKLGRQIEVVYADATPNDLTDNPRTKKEYDQAGRIIAEIDELGNRTELVYDGADRLISRTNALGEVTRYSYDADGRQVAMRDALGRETTYAYDGLDQLTATTYANNSTMNMTYDALGRVIAETDLAGKTTRYEYDALGRLTAVIDPLNQRTEYKYDAVGNLIEQKDAKGQVTKFEYDSLRRRKAMILPSGERSETIHNKIGNLIRTVDFNGVTTTYEYDNRNRLIQKSYSDGTPTETMTYTLTGELATVTDDRGITLYSYDERDRLLSRTEPDSRTISYIYDDAGNVLSLTVPSGTTRYTYDALNRLDTVIDPGSGITDYTYDALGNLIETEFPNGVVETQQYDLLDRLTTLENRNQTGVISSYTYSLDAMGNRTQVVENNGRTVQYEYDDLYRLTRETILDPVNGNRTIEYRFDPVGNRLERIDSVAGSTTYSYDVNDRLLTETTNGQVTEYRYDDQGNLTARLENGQANVTYEWNAKGELVAVETTENGETGRMEFQYNHEGIRVAINIDGEEIRFLVDKTQQTYAQVIEEYTSANQVTASYVHGLDLISQEQGSEHIFYQVDGLGSTRILTNASGTVTDSYIYDAYGQLTSQVGNTSNDYLFAGEQFNSEFGEYYLRARYYDSSTGRFDSRDPFEGYENQPVTLHDYLYGNANPIIYTDPSGEVAFIENALKVGAISGAILAPTFDIICKLSLGEDNEITIGREFEKLTTGALVGAGIGGVLAYASLNAFSYTIFTENPFLFKKAFSTLAATQTLYKVPKFGLMTLLGKIFVIQNCDFLEFVAAGF